MKGWQVIISVLFGQKLLFLMKTMNVSAKRIAQSRASLTQPLHFYQLRYRVHTVLSTSPPASLWNRKYFRRFFYVKKVSTVRIKNKIIRFICLCKSEIMIGNNCTYRYSTDSESIKLCKLENIWSHNTEDWIDDRIFIRVWRTGIAIFTAEGIGSRDFAFCTYVGTVYFSASRYQIFKSFLPSTLLRNFVKPSLSHFLHNNYLQNRPQLCSFLRFFKLKKVRYRTYLLNM